MLLSVAKRRKYDNESLVFASELHNISPAVCKTLHNPGSIAITSMKFIREMLSKCPQDANLKKLFDKLTPKQRLVNVLFYKVKLTQAIRFTSVHVLGHALNISDASELAELATHALVIQVVCYHGGPLYILRVIPVVKL